MEAVLVDALARGRKGKRVVTVDAIGAGPRTVAGVLEGRGVNVRLYTAEDAINEPRKLEKGNVLLVSAMSIDEPTVARIVRAWRRRSKGPVIVGGPIASDPEFIVRVGADIGIHGEAEPVLDKLARHGLLEKPDKDELAKTCGVAYIHDGRLVVKPRCPIMPRRVWEQYRPSTRLIRDYPLYWAARVYVEAVRGCSNYNVPRIGALLPPELRPDKPKPGCAYCSVVSLWGYARSRGIDLLYEEVKALIEEGVHRIVLSGPDFLDYGRDWLIEPKPLVNPSEPSPNLEAIEALLKRLTSIPEVSDGTVSIMVENVKPNLVSDDAARTLGAYLHGTPVHVGAETGSNRLLELLGRPARVHDVVRAVSLLKKYGLRPYVYVMYCLPGEDSHVVMSTVGLIEKLYRLGAEKITAYRFSPLPLSYLEKFVESPPPCLYPHPVKAKAAEVNVRAKKRLIGTITKALVAGIHPRYRRPVAYMLNHGPVLLLEDGVRASPGDLVLARITGVKGDHLVAATALKKLSRVWRPGRRGVG